MFQWDLPGICLSPVEQRAPDVPVPDGLGNRPDTWPLAPDPFSERLAWLTSLPTVR